MVRSATPRATGAVGVALKIGWTVAQLAVIVESPIPTTVPSVMTARL